MLQFNSDGTLAIIIGNERIAAGWECPSAGRLVLINENGHRLGPYRVNIEKRELPRGTFDILISDASLLPFDRRQFTRVEDHAETSLATEATS